MLAGVVDRLRRIDKAAVTMVIPEISLNREGAEERDPADRFGELRGISEM